LRIKRRGKKIIEGYLKKKTKERGKDRRKWQVGCTWRM